MSNVTTRTETIIADASDICGPEFTGQIASNVACALDDMSSYESIEECYWAYWENALNGSEIKRDDANWESASILFDALWIKSGGPKVNGIYYVG